MKKKAEFKMEKIKSVETIFNEKKKKQKEKLNKKLEAISKRIAILTKEKENAQLEMARKAKEKAKKLQDLRINMKLVMKVR